MKRVVTHQDASNRNKAVPCPRKLAAILTHLHKENIKTRKGQKGVPIHHY